MTLPQQQEPHYMQIEKHGHVNTGPREMTGGWSLRETADTLIIIKSAYA